MHKKTLFSRAGRLAVAVSGALALAGAALPANASTLRIAMTARSARHHPCRHLAIEYDVGMGIFKSCDGVEGVLLEWDDFVADAGECICDFHFTHSLE